MSAEIISNREGWVLALEEHRDMTDSDVYRLSAPRWEVRFDVARNVVPGGISVQTQRTADVAEQSIVDAILDNPVVAKEVQKRLARAEWEGYVGARAEETGLEPYTFKYKGRG